MNMSLVVTLEHGWNLYLQYICALTMSMNLEVYCALPIGWSTGQIRICLPFRENRFVPTTTPRRNCSNAMKDIGGILLVRVDTK